MSDRTNASCPDSMYCASWSTSSVKNGWLILMFERVLSSCGVPSALMKNRR